MNADQLDSPTERVPGAVFAVTNTLISRISSQLELPPKGDSALLERPSPVQRRLARAVHRKRALSTVPQEETLTHDAHLKAAEQHELAAHAHRTAAEHHEKGDDVGGRWHAARALEFSDHAYKLAKEAHNKSGQMVTL